MALLGLSVATSRCRLRTVELRVLPHRIHSGSVGWLGLAFEVALVALNVLGIAGARTGTHAHQDARLTLPLVTDWMLADHGAIWLAGVLSGVALLAGALRWWSAVAARLVACFNVALLAFALLSSSAAMCLPFITDLCLDDCRRGAAGKSSRCFPSHLRVCGTFLPRCTAGGTRSSGSGVADGGR